MEDTAQRTEDRRAVKAYLDTITAPKRRGRQVTEASLRKRIDELQQQIDHGQLPPLKRLDAIQQRNDLTGRAGTLGTGDPKEIETAFVTSAARYGERKGITWATWREVGVPAAILKRAGIRR